MPKLPPEDHPHHRLRTALERHAHAIRRTAEHAARLQEQKDQDARDLQELIRQETDPNGPPVESQTQAG